MGISGRSPDLGDILRDQLGCLLALIFFCAKKQSPSLKGYSLYKWIVTGLLVLAFIPLLRAGVDDWMASRQFPILSDFETSFEKDRWETENEVLSIEDTIVKHGKHSLKIQLTTGRYSGVSLEYFPGNWLGFKQLVIDVYNPDTGTLYLACRIHDRSHNNKYNDRFNKGFNLHKGWNTLHISLDEVRTSPVGRRMDMEHIENLKLFVIKADTERLIYIDNVRLK